MRYALLIVLIATGISACNSTKPPRPLTESETVALLHGIFGLFEALDAGATTVDCPVGGEANLNDTVDEGEDGDSSWFSGRVTILLADCEIDVVSDTLTLNGKPDLKYAADAWVVVNDDFEVVKGELKIAMTGAMTWRRRNGDSDACSVDMKFELTDWDGDDDITGDFAGRMCGLDLAIDMSEAS